MPHSCTSNCRRRDTNQLLIFDVEEKIHGGLFAPACRNVQHEVNDNVKRSN